MTAREFDLMYAMFLYTGNITLYCYTQQSRIQLFYVLTSSSMAPYTPRPVPFTNLSA